MTDRGGAAEGGAGDHEPVEDDIFAAAVEAGMKTLREDGIRLCRAGVSSLEEIRRVTGDRIQ